MTVLFLAGLLLRLRGLKPAGTGLWLLAGVFLAVLLLLVAIEGHQGKVLYRMAKQKVKSVRLRQRMARTYVRAIRLFRPRLPRA